MPSTRVISSFYSAVSRHPQATAGYGQQDNNPNMVKSKTALGFSFYYSIYIG